MAVFCVRLSRQCPKVRYANRQRQRHPGGRPHLVVELTRANGEAADEVALIYSTASARWPARRTRVRLAMLALIYATPSARWPARRTRVRLAMLVDRTTRLVHPIFPPQRRFRGGNIGLDFPVQAKPPQSITV